MLLTQHDLSETAIDAHLTIVEGNIKDLATVKRALLGPSNRPVDIIVNGVGGAPKFQLSLTCPFTLDDPHICEGGMASILSALRFLTADSKTTANDPKPMLVIISATGVSKTRRDTPLPIVPLYHWLGAIPHADKAAMEKLVFEAVGSGDKDEVLASFVVVRPSLLTDGTMRGADSVRVGWEAPSNVDRNAPGPAIGYTISRRDVGNWIFEETIQGEALRWEGKCVTLTY